MTPKIGFIFLFMLVCFSLHSQTAHAATVNAISCSSTDVQNAVNSASAGDTVAVPSCASTVWTTAVNISGKALTLQGQTSVSPSAPTQQPTSATDNTNITINVTSGFPRTGLNVTCTASNFVEVTGFTFTSATSQSQGMIDFNGTHGNTCFRFDHNHIKIPNGSGSITIYTDQVWGLVDHLLMDSLDQNSSGNAINVSGDASTAGFVSWNDPTSFFGTGNAVVVEDSTLNFATNYDSSEGVFDGYAGGRLLFRNNTVNNAQFGGWHGTDSGGLRSFAYADINHNTFTNNASGNTIMFNIRGGTFVIHDNTWSGSTTWTNIALQYYRALACIGDIQGQWGTCGAALRWTPVSMNPQNNNGRMNTANAPDFLAIHSYPAQSVVGPLSNNSGAWNFQVSSGCTSGSYPNTWNQTIGGTTTDSGGCVWLNVGSNTQPGPGGAGFCAANPDTQCSSDSTCSQLSPGDKCSRYFDSSTVCRDQPGRSQNQTLTPIYSWNETGGANPELGTDCSGSILTQGIDFFNNTPMPGYTPYTYPDPLQTGNLPQPPSPPTGLNAQVE